MFKANNPGCPCCCPQCDIWEVREGTSIINDFSQVSGSWSIITGGNGFLRTTDNDALCIYGTPATADAFTYGASTEYRPVDNVVYKMVFAFADADNYCYVSMYSSGNTGYFSLYERIAGAETQLDTWTRNLGFVTDQHVLQCQVCYNAGEIKIRDPGTWLPRISNVSNASSLGRYCGFGTGTVSGNTADFFWGNLDELKTYCPHCFCSTVLWDKVPDSFQVEISGVVNGIWGACALFNATFILDERLLYSTFLGSEITSGCYWVKTIDDPGLPGAYVYLTVQLVYVTATEIKLYLFVTDSGTKPIPTPGAHDIGVSSLVAICGQTDPEKTVDGLTLNLYDAVAYPACDFSNATAVITAIY
jgi:hypothetical protein